MFLLQTSLSIYERIICYCKFFFGARALLVFIDVKARFFCHLVTINGKFMVFAFEIQNPSGFYESSIVRRVKLS